MASTSVEQLPSAQVIPVPSQRPPSLCERRLMSEWEELTRSPRGGRALRRWRLRSSLFDGLGSLQDTVNHIQSLDRDESNPFYWFLSEAHYLGDDLAGRLLLQLVLPGLRWEIARWERWQGRTGWKTTPARTGPSDPRLSDVSLRGDELAQVVMAAGAQAIHELQRHHEPSWPILTIMRRTRRLILKAVREAERWAEVTATLDTHNLSPTLRCTDVGQAPESPDAAVRLAVTLGDLVQIGTISQENAALILRTRSGAATFDELAAQTGCSADTLRKRRQRAELSISGALAEAA